MADYNFEEGTVAEGIGVVGAGCSLVEGNTDVVYSIVDLVRCIVVGCSFVVETYEY